VVLAKVAHCSVKLLKLILWSTIIASALFGAGSLVAPATLDTYLKRMFNPLGDVPPPKALPLAPEDYMLYEAPSLLPLKGADGNQE
jgi:hypothetical protein